LGPLRQDEHFVPTQHFARQRGTHGAPAPPFPLPNCASKFEDGAMFAGVGEGGDPKLGYWHQNDCTFDATQNPTVNLCDDVPCAGDDCEGDNCGMLFEPDLQGRCECTGPGKQCSCVREFLMHLRPPGINGYDGLVSLCTLDSRCHLRRRAPDAPQTLLLGTRSMACLFAVSPCRT
jgi:hypothetical protein